MKFANKFSTINLESKNLKTKFAIGKNEFIRRQNHF